MFGGGGEESVAAAVESGLDRVLHNADDEAYGNGSVDNNMGGNCLFTNHGARIRIVFQSAK